MINGQALVQYNPCTMGIVGTLPEESIGVPIFRSITSVEVNRPMMGTLRLQDIKRVPILRDCRNFTRVGEDAPRSLG